MSAKTKPSQRNPLRRTLGGLVILVILLAAVAGLLAAPYLGAHVLGTRSLVEASAATPAAAPYIAAPTTAAGYQAMFDRLDVDEWGAADVGISIPLSASRTVWLFADTLSENHGIVNSTAITQDGGRLHISEHGNQLLPHADNDDQGRTVVYWIEAARKIGANSIEVTVAPTWASNTGADGAAWGRTTTRDRTGIVTVDQVGDVTFDHWTGWTARPKLNTKFLTVAEGAPYQREGHVFYNKQLHHEAHLASGNTLVTICQNRIKPAKRADGGIDYPAYRLIFSEEQS